MALVAPVPRPAGSPGRRHRFRGEGSVRRGDRTDDLCGDHGGLPRSDHHERSWLRPERSGWYRRLRGRFHGAAALSPGQCAAGRPSHPRPRVQWRVGSADLHPRPQDRGASGGVHESGHLVGGVQTGVLGRFGDAGIPGDGQRRVFAGHGRVRPGLVRGGSADRPSGQHTAGREWPGPSAGPCRLPGQDDRGLAGLARCLDLPDELGGRGPPLG